MTGLLIAFVVIIGVLVIIQVMKINKLSSDLQDGKDLETTDKDNNLQGTLLLTFGILFMLSFFWMLYAWMPLTLSIPGSLHGESYDSLMNISMALIIVVFVIINPILFYFAFRFRGSKNRKATFISHNDKLEMFWTTVPALVLGVLIIYGMSTWSNVMNPDNSKEQPIVIELYAQQFNWTARYAGEDNMLGYANVGLIKGANYVGVDLADPLAADDIVTKELYLPKGRPVLFKFRSQDVIHSAYMPHFRMQMNCVPGMVTQFQFTPTVTSAEMRTDKKIINQVTDINKIRAAEGKDLWEFDYILLCNKICGNAHYNMQMPIKVVEEAEYNKWLSSQKKLAQN